MSAEKRRKSDGELVNKVAGRLDARLKRELARLSSAPETPQGLAAAARVIERAERGLELGDVARLAGVPRAAARQALQDFKAHGMTGLRARLSGVFDDGDRPIDLVFRLHRLIVQTVVCHAPPEGSKGWEPKTVAKHLGLVEAEVEQVWAAYRLSPADTLMVGETAAEAEAWVDQELDGLLEHYRGKTRGELAPPAIGEWEGFLRFLRSGCSRDTAAARVGIDARHVEMRMEHDVEFARDVVRAEADAVGKIEEGISEKARGKAKVKMRRRKWESGVETEREEVETELPPDAKAAELVLRARKPDQYGRAADRGGPGHVTLIVQGVEGQPGAALPEEDRLLLEARTGRTIDAEAEVVEDAEEPEDAELEEVGPHV